MKSSNFFLGNFVFFKKYASIDNLVTIGSLGYENELRILQNVLRFPNVFH